MRSQKSRLNQRIFASISSAETQGTYELPSMQQLLYEDTFTQMESCGREISRPNLLVAELFIAVVGPRGAKGG